VKQAVRRLLHRQPVWRVRTDPVRGRRRALRQEVAYWAEWLGSSGGKYADDFARRFDPEAEVEDPALRDVLAAVPGGPVSVLDVGAGPASSVGLRFPGLDLTVVAVDPLGKEYDRLLARAGLVPPVHTEAVDGEDLVAHFGEDRFDIAYSRNALDHSVDPVAVIEQMLRVVRPGGHVVLRHGVNEAVNQGYVQLHQWNLEERDGAFVVWRPDRTTNVTTALAGRAEVACWTEDDAVVCDIRRL
jgi:SAM-dependent methyltransferase